MSSLSCSLPQKQTATLGTTADMLDSAQSQISFDDDNELFRQDTDAESDGEEQQELDEEDARDEQRAGEPAVELVPAEPPSPGGDVKLKEEQERKEPQATATPKLLPKGKEAIPVAQPPHSEPVAEKRKPLTLVELPVDVLKEIVKEVNHTNDLTNLSLTCHCLHVLAIPHIYSRFDIVWPDALTPGERTGVDALTYGLATLVAAGPRGNDYARWVKKFSLGNGPGEWVSEYNINKEGGKMLGTLVCLAITRMISLETFSWDMPTGVLRDVFKALHDLNGRLKNVHVRFHDNTETTTPTSQDPKRRVETPTFKGFSGLRSLSVLDIDERQYLEEISYAVENSVGRLKELRLGLSAQVPPCGRWIRDLDEVPHGDSAGVIGGPLAAVGGVLGIVVSRIIDLEEGRRRRKSTRPEVTTGGLSGAVNTVVEVAETVVTTTTAATAATAPVAVHPSGDAAPTAPVVIPEGSLLSAAALASSVALPLPTLSAESSIVVVGDGGETDVGVLSTLPFNIVGPAAVQETIPGTGTSVPTPLPTPTPTPTPIPTSAPPPLFASESTVVPPVITIVPRPIKVRAPEQEEEKPVRQLKLETLELERVPISIRVLTKAIDWTCLSNLTILNCHDHDRLWKALRTKFSPHQPNAASSSKSSYQLHHTTPGHRSRSSAQGPGDYKIRLKKLHTDMVTPQLLYFIRDALPPNSLEVLFLQETPNFSSVVAMDFIYRAAVRRHRGSLRKLLVDSNVGMGGENAAKWIFEKEVLAFVSSGKMPQLRELGMAIEWKNWHYFLTRLPAVPQLRSLYIHYVRGGPHITDYEAKEMAQQIVNTVILRPEIEMCYVGVLNKCFELLEDGGVSDGSEELSESGDTPHAATGGANGTGVVAPAAAAGADSADEDSDGGDEDDEDEDEDEEDDADETDTDADAAGAEKDLSEDEEWGREKGEKGVRVRLREILFYDDKVAVFRARGGKL